jgi:predicted RNase H-like HicB family nuclease
MKGVCPDNAQALGEDALTIQQDLVLQGENEMYSFLVIIKRGSENYGAYSPDLPGCIAVGDTREEAEENMRAAIALHLQGMIEDHEPIPSSQAIAKYMDVPFPESVA